MLTKSESKYIQDAHRIIHELGELLDQYKRENAELRKKRRMGKDESPYDVLAVTDVKVYPFNESLSLGHMKGLAQVVLNDQLVIRGLRIMEGADGMFVGYPVDHFYKGEDFRNLVTPMTKQLKDHIEAVILESYREAINGGKNG